MAKRVLNRRQLRAEADQAALAGPAAKEAEEPAPAKPARAARKPRPKKVKEPQRLRARWGVFDNGMKRVAVFDYSQRAAADQKLADLNARKAGTYFLQIVKEPLVAPPPAPPE